MDTQRPSSAPATSQATSQIIGQALQASAAASDGLPLTFGLGDSFNISDLASSSRLQSPRSPSQRSSTSTVNLVVGGDDVPPDAQE